MPGERQLHLRDLVQVLLVHWKVVVFATFLVLLATWTASRRSVRRYQSQASVQISSKKQVFARLDDIDVDELQMRTDPVLSEALVLSTQSLAQTVSGRLGLRLQFDDPEIRRNDVVYDVQVDSLARPDSFELRITGPQGYEVRDERGRLAASGGYDAPAVGPGFTFMVHEYDGAPYSVRFAILAPVTAADQVRGGIGFAVQQNTNVVNVTYTGTDPSLVPDVLNEAMRALQNYGADRARDVMETRLRYIRVRVDSARSEYLATLGRVQSYRETQHTTDLSAEEVALINSIQDSERDRERKLLDLATLRGIVGTGQDVTIDVLNSLAGVPGVADNPAITYQMESLLKLYDDRRTLVAGSLGMREASPQVEAIDQRIQQGSRALSAAASATIRGLEATITSLTQNISDLRARLATYPGKQTQLAQLTLESELQNETYKYLLSQLEAARISAATIAPYIQIVEYATVAGHIGMTTRQKLTIGLVVGLFLGVVGAFFLEYLDQTIKSSADVERALDVPVLGLIPFEPKGRGAQSGNGRRRQAIPLVSLHSPDDPTSEAYRALRTNVTFVNAEQRALQLLVVTSPGPGEGKSTTAANLAITLAQQGTPTLLVDADLRRPLVHRAFDLVQEPGLTDVLVGKAMLREAIRPNVIPKLDVLPAGALPPNPSELLGSEAMHRLLEQLRGQYDTIIFDSPPTLAVTDATVLGASSDGVILVLRAGETEELAAQRAIEQLRRVQARVAGTVLNGVERERGKYYNYYVYHRHGRPTAGGPLAALRERIKNLL